MSGTKERLRRIREVIDRLPPGSSELTDAEERLRSRYTVALDLQRQVAHWLTGKLDEYEPRDPTPGEMEEIRAHARKWRLPCASEKTIAEARAFLADDTPDQALRDGRLLGGQWCIWVEELYLPALKAQRGGKEGIFEFAWVFLKRVRAEHRAWAASRTSDADNCTAGPPQVNTRPVRGCPP